MDWRDRRLPRGEIRSFGEEYDSRLSGRLCVCVRERCRQRQNPNLSASSVGPAGVKKKPSGLSRNKVVKIVGTESRQESATQTHTKPPKKEKGKKTSVATHGGCRECRDVNKDRRDLARHGAPSVRTRNTVIGTCQRTTLSAGGLHTVAAEQGGTRGRLLGLGERNLSI